jgi:hypothetical protein
MPQMDKRQRHQINHKLDLEIFFFIFDWSSTIQFPYDFKIDDGHFFILEFSSKRWLKCCHTKWGRVVCMGCGVSSQKYAKFAAGVVDTGGNRWQICHRCHWYRWSTLSCEYLREFSKKFETAQMVYSGAWEKLIHEKNQKQKISWHCGGVGMLLTVWDSAAWLLCETDSLTDTLPKPARVLKYKVHRWLVL